MSAEIDAIQVAEKVLSLDEIDDYEAILNLAASSAANKISKDSPVASMRKLYLKLSLIIHPDRLGKKFENATKAFQALVRAFERLSAPPLIEEVDASTTGKKGNKQQKPVQISRSNEGCFRTRVCCPRCKTPWNEGTLDGNPDYCYNFLMTGLKSFTCSTCLCEFGCMSALHQCPHCRNKFEYSPDDFHKRVSCGNKSCNKPFGFHLYHVSDRAIKDVKSAVKIELENRIKAKEAKVRRAARSSGRAARRGGEEDQQTVDESSFMLGLLDTCPRCGEDFTEIEDEALQRQHLMECNDTKKQQVYKEHKQKAQKKATAMQEKSDAQENVQTFAAWQMLGANDSQLWLLTDGQVRNHAAALGIGIDGANKDELISSIVANSKSKEVTAGLIEDANDLRMIANSSKGSSSGSSSSLALTVKTNNASKGALVVSKKRNRESDGEDIRQTIPSNMQGLSFERLHSLCASHGLLQQVKKKATRQDLIDLLEDKFFDAN